MYGSEVSAGLTRRETLAMSAAFAASAVATAWWPTAASALAGPAQLSASRAESYAAALDALAVVDPYVDRSRVDEVSTAFASRYRSLLADARRAVDGVLDALEGPDHQPLAAGGAESSVWRIFGVLWRGSTAVLRMRCTARECKARSSPW